MLYKLISIGLYDAAHSLSVILGRPIKIKKPAFERPSLKGLNHVLEKKGNGHNIVSLTFDDTSKPVKANLLQANYSGQTLFLLDERQTEFLAHMYAGTTDLSMDLVESAAREVGNVLAGSILNSVANKLNFMLTPSLPNLYKNISLSNESISKIVECPDFFNKSENNVLIIRTAFIDTQSTEINIMLYILFFNDTYNRLANDIKQTILTSDNE